MILHDLHPVVKILIATILCMMIGGGAGYILYIVNGALDRWDEKKKREAAKPLGSTERHINIKL